MTGSWTLLQKGPALLCCFLIVVQCAGCGEKKPPPGAAPQVQVVPVVQRDVSIYSEWVATLDGYVNAQIQPQVSGYLIKQDYREGSFVHKDDVLFEIDPRPFQAVLDQAKAQLAQAEAQLGNATLNVNRDIPEAEANAIARSQLEGDTQAQLAAKATVAAGRAAVEQAALNLSFTKVRSLISGIAGIAQVQVGNLVTPSAVLTGVSQVDPIKTYFPISGEDYLRIADKIHPETVNLLSSDSPIPLQLILANGNTYARSGGILFADRQVDQQTGTIRIAGAFANPGNILRPGQYGKVRAVTQILKGALMVPQRAVSQLQGSTQVAVVGTDNKVAIRSVQTGERVDTMWVITGGLAAGDRVVAEGVQKVKDGSIVTPTPFTSASAPTPTTASAGH
ncbi:MAG TPA: efflux RND transporter periplasmic adaptor subunit [Steroidobacteraceae bacterium]|nr:efflux RND transporter periplasmic adaptor subunit [Steroidobacteraceae bacterium]